MGLRPSTLGVPTTFLPIQEHLTQSFAFPILSSRAMSMISNALITGGTISQTNDNRQIYMTQTQKSAIDRLQDAVAPAAFHNSGDRFDPPKCHPNTRVAVRDKVEKWALRMDPDTRDASILWLSGAAGAGKSAIAQTLAEHLDAKGLLAASFFFGRSDSTRNHARSLVSTIVYQMYSLLPPPEQSRILAMIDCDPLIFTKSLLAQFEALLVNPLQPLFNSGLWTRRLVIIDGLDECLDRDMQRNVLLMVAASVRQFHAPFIFLLASRPEHDIAAIISSPDYLPIHTRLFLDNTYLPDHDIELFLRDQFEECRTTHPFRHMIPLDWPSDDTVQKLMEKSSGQFIYASVITKYVKSSRHRPHHRLDVVLSLRSASKDLAFSELDALYTHILSSVDNVESVLNVVSFHIIFFNTAITHIERILELDEGEVAILLCDLASVIGYENYLFGGLQLKMHHASLIDYLLDSARSKEYFINASTRCAGYVADCFQFLSYTECQNSLRETAGLAMICFIDNHLSLDLTEPLYDAIRQFSAFRLYNWAFTDLEELIERPLAGNLFRVLVFRFLPAFCKFLKKSIVKDPTKYIELYPHHQSECDLLLRENINSCSPESPISLFFALVAIYRELPISALLSQFVLFDRSHFEGPTIAAIQHGYSANIDWNFVEHLSDFLRDPTRSREFCAGPKLFAQAAKHCLFYLCNHTAYAQKAPPRVSAQKCMQRKHTPWKWHRRVLREDIRGPSGTPWLWLIRPINNQVTLGMPAPVLRHKENNLIYANIDNALLRLFFSVHQHPPINHRINSEKYHLALIYLNHFLPRAGKLDELVHMCRKLTFASRSQDFPRKSARARSNMQKYVAQWG